MMHRRIACAALLLAALLPNAALAATPDQELDQMMGYDGLVRTKVNDIDLAYARPGTTLAGYRFIKLDPVEVSFRKDWTPTKGVSDVRLSAAERESIRKGIAKVVFDEFAVELHSRGGYKLVMDPDGDVLRVRVHILNLAVNPPTSAVSAGGLTYVVSTGEMTILAELFDSESGQILARVVDRREARKSNRLSVSGGAVDAAEAARIASGWAQILRRGLDRAREAGGK
jgi:hypothetical protein